MFRISVLLSLFLLFFAFSFAQDPDKGMSAAEVEKMVNDIKADVVKLEAKIKKAEQDDPRKVPALKEELASLQLILTAMGQSGDKPAKGAVAPKATTARPVVVSPITRVHLVQPVTTPTAAQAKDRYFWYMGRKVNDSALVTRKGTLVQYSRKRNMLIIEPEKKLDSFLLMAGEIGRNEERKEALADKMDKKTNGFIFYPYVAGAANIYDDLARRYTSAVNNTIPMAEHTTPVAWHITEGTSNTRGHGPSMDDEPGSVLPLDDVFRQLEKARSKFASLPPLREIPAPPRRELGLCPSCREDMLRKQRIQDSLWEERYQGQEAEVVQIAVSAGREYQLGGYKDSADRVTQEVNALFNAVLERLLKKDELLIAQYADKLEYLNAIIPVVLGHERQAQLLGAGEYAARGSFENEIIQKALKAYEQYYIEQVSARNHDFVLNLAFHLGMVRTLQLLGDDKGLIFDVVMDRFQKYNRFALNMSMEFDYEERGSDGTLYRKATGVMATKEKTLTMLIPDNCGYRMVSYSADIANRDHADITVPFTVSEGARSEMEDGKLKTVPYTGPEKWYILFPDTRISFCEGEGQDIMYMSMFLAGKGYEKMAEEDILDHQKRYRTDMAIYGEYLFSTGKNEPGTDKSAKDVLHVVNAASAMGTPGSKMEKIRNEYKGYMMVDDARTKMQNSMNSGNARIYFDANNRSSVLADKYLDMHRVLKPGRELKKGMIYVHLGHEPLN